LRTVLERQGKGHAAEASYNNHWGVPLTLARMPVDADFAIIEIGMNHPGEIAPLARMAQLDVAMITTVAAAHLEAFENIEGIAREKAAIFEGLVAGGNALLPGDLDVSPILAEAAEKSAAVRHEFGAADQKYRLGDVQLLNDTTVVRAQIRDIPILFKLMVAGRHFATNAVAVLAAADLIGADTALAAQDLSLWVPPAGRGTREVRLLDPIMQELSFELIDDAFNANPTSMVAALEVLAAATPRDGVGRIEKGRRIAVLGDMLELGPDEIQMHSDIADLPNLAHLDVIHCVGPRMRSLFDRLPADAQGGWSETATELSGQANILIDAGDVVLVKGSKGSKVSLVVDALRKLSHPLASTDED